MKQFEEKNAQVVGLSADTRQSMKAWGNSLGGITHPLLSDFWPHGDTLKAYDIFNPDAGNARRSLTIIDPQGVVRHTELHQGTLPTPEAALAKLTELQG